MHRVLKRPRSLKRFRSLHIRWQMTLLYTLVFMLLICLLGLLFYFNLNSTLETSEDSELQEHAQEIATVVQYPNGKLSTQAITNDFLVLVNEDSGGDQFAHNSTSVSDVDVDPLVRILDQAGNPIFLSPAVHELKIPAVSVTQALHNVPWIGTVSAVTGQSVRIYSQPLVYKRRVVGVIQVGESLTSYGNTLRSTIVELLLTGAIGLALSFLLSYWLATRAFAPIKKMTGIARRITAADLHERVPLPPGKDELHTLAITFNEMIERLEQEFMRQRRFVADASHELRTPVAAIRSMTDVAMNQQHGASNDYLATLRDVNAESERLGFLISDLLDLARTDENQVVLEREKVRLDVLAVDVAATIEPLASEKGIILNVSAGQPATVIGDEVRLIQVMMNLIDNAIAYTNAGGTVQIRIEVREVSVFLIVSDSGIGIAPEHLEHIFERFYRVDSARSRAAGGSGLGLAIVDWIVRAHHGTIQVESQVGVGTTFTVQLPLSASPTSATASASATGSSLQKSYKS